MSQDPDTAASIRKWIGSLLDEALALADQIGDHGTAAQIAQALHTFDPARSIAMPPDEVADTEREPK